MFPGWYVLRGCLLYHFQRSKHVRHRRLRFAVFTTITSPQMLMAKYGLEVSWQFLRNQWGSKAVVIVYKWWFNGHIIWYKQQYHIISYHYHIIIISYLGVSENGYTVTPSSIDIFFPSTIGIRGTHIFWNWETAISRTLNMKIPVVNFTFTISMYIYIRVYIYV